MATGQSGFAFSRLQLAAALLEYDNDDTDPAKSIRSAHDSAIFSHLRNNPPRSETMREFNEVSRRSMDYLGVQLPSEAGGIHVHDSVASEACKSRASLDMLRNPFGEDFGAEGEADEQGDHELEVDLSSWGLESYIPTEKLSKSARKRSKSEALPNPHLPITQGDTSLHRLRSSKAFTLNNFESFGVGGAFLDATSAVITGDSRRRSFGSALDLARSHSPQRPQQRPRASSHNVIESLLVTPPLHSVPFPTDSIPFPVSQADENTRSVDRPPSLFNPQVDPISQAHGRTYSSASLGTRIFSTEDSDLNPFALRPPSPTRSSRFDPKSISHARNLSNAIRLLDDENPSKIRPPSPSYFSPLDPKAATRARTLSNASFGSRGLLENDARSFMTGDGLQRENRYSRMELMRPKVLVMPSPLQAADPIPAPQTDRSGFQLSSDGPPLPGGARASRAPSRMLSTLQSSSSLVVPLASNAFTPNPRLSMSLSQLTFRHSLMVGGERDIAYSDLDRSLRRAQEEGEQVQLNVSLEEHLMEKPTDFPAVLVEDVGRTNRPAGKLFGKSLIEDLEARKSQLHNKRRVFTGDQRPSMMDRGPLKRSSTLIDPATLQERSTSQRTSSLASQDVLGRRGSSLGKPLLNFEDGLDASPNAKMAQTHSVFGVDTLWEREMVKLREIEAQERINQEEERKRQGEADGKKRKKKGKGNEKEKIEGPSGPAVTSIVELLPTSDPSNISLSALLVPQKRIPRRGPPPPEIKDGSESDSESDDGQKDASLHQRPGKLSGSPGASMEARTWFAGSSDEGDGPIRTTGTGPRYPTKLNRQSAHTQSVRDDSEEDIPLAETVGRAIARATFLQTASKEDEGDEDLPLSSLLSRSALPSVRLNRSQSRPDNDDDDEDNEPLAIRMSRVAPSMQLHSVRGDDDDDDVPLAMHPEQQRRTRYMMLAQQQQMMMQAQLQIQIQNAMTFGPTPTVMGSGFFGPPMPPGMMMQPAAFGSPSLIPEEAKLGRVDRWRRDVAVEGSE